MPPSHPPQPGGGLHQRTSQHRRSLLQTMQAQQGSQRAWPRSRRPAPALGAGWLSAARTATSAKCSVPAATAQQMRLMLMSMRMLKLIQQARSAAPACAQAATAAGARAAELHQPSCCWRSSAAARMAAAATRGAAPATLLCCWSTLLPLQLLLRRQLPTAAQQKLSHLQAATQGRAALALLQ